MQSLLAATATVASVFGHRSGSLQAVLAGLAFTSQ
jgi:hypothetical protein